MPRGRGAVGVDVEMRRDRRHLDRLAARVFTAEARDVWRALTPGARITILARSGSLDSLTLDGPRGRATLGLRPAALIRVLPGEADPGLFHTVPAH